MFALLLIGATVGIEVVEVAELTPLEASTLVDELAHALERESRATAVVAITAAAPCTAASSRCADALPATLDARLAIKLFGGLTVVRVEVARDAIARAADVPRDLDGARVALAELARQVFPTRLAPPPLEPTNVGAPRGDEHRLRTLALVPLGVSVVLGGLGVGFGLSSEGARSGAEEPGISAERFDALAERVEDHGTLANALIIGGAVAATGALALLLIDLVE